MNNQHTFYAYDGLINQIHPTITYTEQNNLLKRKQKQGVLLKAARNRPKPSGRRLNQSRVESVQDQHETCDAVLRFAIYSRIFGRPFVKRFALCYRSVVLVSVLSVTLVHCGQTVGRIKMKLSMQVA